MFGVQLPVYLDAVYYGYNAMNRVTAVATADYVRQHTTY